MSLYEMKGIALTNLKRQQSQHSPCRWKDNTHLKGIGTVLTIKVKVKKSPSKWGTILTIKASGEHSPLR